MNVADLLLYELDLSLLDFFFIAGLSPCSTKNGGCSHLCLVSPGGKSYRCACPQQMQLNSDNRTCNVTCSSTSQFHCNVGDDKCIPIYMYCDGVADCLGGEDEPSTCRESLISLLKLDRKECEFQENGREANG
jgi:hypothetical protein